MILVPIIATVGLGSLGLAWILRRRFPADLDISSHVEEIQAKRPDLLFQIERKLPEEDRAKLKQAFHPSPDFRWVMVGGETFDESNETLMSKYDELNSYLLECMVQFIERYGYVLVCRDATTLEYLGSVAYLPPYPSNWLFYSHFVRTVIPMGQPPAYQWKDPVLKARFDSMETMWNMQKEVFELKGRRDHVYVANVGVAPAAQGKGVGKLMMQVVQQLADGQPLLLECLDKNVAFYQKCGYERALQYELQAKGEPTTLPYNTMYCNAAVDVQSD